MVNGSFRSPKPKPTLPPHLRGGKIGRGWYEDTIRDSRFANSECDDKEMELKECSRKTEQL